MNKTELVKNIARESGIKKESVNIVINTFIGEVEEQLKKNQQVNIAGFGKFFLKTYKGRTITTPDGERMELEQRPSPRFKISNALKHKIVNALN